MSGFLPQRLFEIFQYQMQYYPQEVAIGEWNDQKWTKYNTQKCIDDIRSLALGIVQQGWQPGDRVGILSQLGSYAWVVCDAALQMNGIIPVPLHASSNTKQLSYILDDAAIQHCFISNEEQAVALLEVADNKLPNLQLYSFSETQFPHWTSLFAEADSALNQQLEKRIEGVDPAALATIIYTSGTTGDPKGVMLSHQNILSNILSTIVLIPVNASAKVLSYLPLSHIFERMVIYSYLMTGASIYFSKSVNTILEDLQEIRPNYFTSVPRLLERVHEKILLESTTGNQMKRRIVSGPYGLVKNMRPKRVFNPFLLRNASWRMLLFIANGAIRLVVE